MTFMETLSVCKEIVACTILLAAAGMLGMVTYIIHQMSKE